MEEKNQKNELIAYEIYQPNDMPLIPAPINRPWMDNTPKRFAYRCLPLTIANQAGWFICNPRSFSARWNGGQKLGDVTIVFDESPPDTRITSLFGQGTITFNMPFLFRTPQGMNLWVKGPTNWPKDAAAPLEGIVETDWTNATFTMNWKLTRPGQLVRFERGEPICMVLPYPRNLLNEIQPVKMPLDCNQEVSEAYQRWSDERNEFHAKIRDGDEDATKRGWQKDYFQGRDPGADRFEGHQTKMGVKPFSNPVRNEDE
ncbi:DUF6065 family protein [Stieleria tagensis]|uniref:DUF6065 family protein n=1 Tax=Stieleria tagensis TaxID=2956795 RepID=UPI00209B5476|nr:DUF6065 family protein [Stieleria tagensis]